MVGTKSNLALLALALSTAGCAGTPVPSDAPAVAPTVEPRLAPARLHAQLAQWLNAPRALGDARRDASIDRLETALREAGADVVARHATTGVDPATGTRYALTNLYGHVRPAAPHRFVLATHFDTRPWADEDPDPAAHTRPIVGANDGTSGLTIVLALAPLLATRLPANVGFSVLLFDGEELGRPDGGGYCVGSRALADSVAAGEAVGLAATNAEFGIVLDMVGDADLRIAPEPTSMANAPSVVRTIWATARARGHTAFVDTVRAAAIVDDHTFLSQAGVPSVLLIDDQYSAWHTTGDTLDRTSGESLAVVADVVLHTLLTRYAAGTQPGGAA